MLKFIEQHRRNKALAKHISNDPGHLDLLVRLQTMLKGRLAHRPPSAEASSYPWIVGGNEPDFVVAPQFDTGRLALLGCGCLKSIEAAFSLIDFDHYEPSIDGYTNVPKLFIADTSLYVKKAWQRLKQLVSEHDSLEQFMQALEDIQIFKGLSDKDLNNVKNRFVQRLTTFCHTQQDYLLFRAMVQKATFMQLDWLDAKVSEYIKQHNTQPLAIYASNIHEVVVDTHGLQGVETLLDNMTRLNPVVTIYTRTSLTQTAALKGATMPDQVDVVLDAHKDEHRDVLFQYDSQMHFAKLSVTCQSRDEFIEQARAVIASLRPDS